MKIPATKFEVLWSESNVQAKRVFLNWRDIGQHVRRIAQFAPRGGGYDKTVIRVTFADDETYECRLDIQHYTLPFEVNDNDLARHIRQFLSFNTGAFCPSHMTQEEYQDYLNGSGKQIQVESQQYLDKYDIPESDGVIVDATIYHCQSCKLPFHYGLFSETDVPKLCGRCLHEQEAKDAAQAKREAARTIRESDPLWPVLQAGRSAVTKKMRQLLRQRSGKTWSVRGGRGTGWGWLEICAPPSRMDGWKMTDADQEELSDLLGKRVHCQGHSISSDEWWEHLKACRGDN